MFGNSEDVVVVVLYRHLLYQTDSPQHKHSTVIISREETRERGTLWVQIQGHYRVIILQLPKIILTQQSDMRAQQWLIKMKMIKLSIVTLFLTTGALASTQCSSEDDLDWGSYGYFQTCRTQHIKQALQVRSCDLNLILCMCRHYYLVYATC